MSMLQQRRQRIEPIVGLGIVGHQLVDDLAGIGLIVRLDIGVPLECQEPFLRLVLALNTSCMVAAASLYLPSLPWESAKVVKVLGIVGARLHRLFTEFDCLGIILLLEVDAHHARSQVFC